MPNAFFYKYDFHKNNLKTFLQFKKYYFWNTMSLYIKKSLKFILHEAIVTIVFV